MTDASPIETDFRDISSYVDGTLKIEIGIYGKRMDEIVEKVVSEMLAYSDNGEKDGDDEETLSVAEQVRKNGYYRLAREHDYEEYFDIREQDFWDDYTLRVTDAHLFPQILHSLLEKFAEAYKVKWNELHNIDEESYEMPEDTKENLKNLVNHFREHEIDHLIGSMEASSLSSPRDPLEAEDVDHQVSLGISLYPVGGGYQLTCFNRLPKKTNLKTCIYSLTRPEELGDKDTKEVMAIVAGLIDKGDMDYAKQIVEVIRPKVDDETEDLFDELLAAGPQVPADEE